MPYNAKNGKLKPYPAPKVPKSTTKPKNNTKRMGSKGK